MSTKRRIGVSLATTEAARRALMQPVPCWEKVWTTPTNANMGSTMKVYKWVKTDKEPVSFPGCGFLIFSRVNPLFQQHFSDDEDETDDIVYVSLHDSANPERLIIFC